MGVILRERALFHYTNEKAYKAISSQPAWLFRASKPPGDPEGAYFTNLPPGTLNLAKRLFLRGGAAKVAYVFCFSGGEDLRPLPGGRGQFIFYSETDYVVEVDRQGPHGATSEVVEKLP